MAESTAPQSTSPATVATDGELKSDAAPKSPGNNDNIETLTSQEEMANSARTETELSKSTAVESDILGQSEGESSSDAQASPMRGESTETNAKSEDNSLEGESPLFTVSDETIDQLSRGFLQSFVPHIETSYNSLDELMRNQRVLIETVQQENVKCNENHIVTELAELMTEARIYHSKLVNVKKEMTTLHERTTKLKKRALKLQQQKMKDNLAKEQQREKELEQERHLIARPAAQRQSSKGADSASKAL